MIAIYATTADGTIVQGLRFEDDDFKAAQAEWKRLDDSRFFDRLFPQVKHFEVRDTADPKYAKAVRNPAVFARVITPRGFGDEEYTPGRRTLTRTGAEKAARAAWRLFVPTVGGRNLQGHGGWYYSSNGAPVAQGMRDLVRVALRHNLIVEGQDGRWYVTEVADPAHFDREEVAV